MLECNMGLLMLTFLHINFVTYKHSSLFIKMPRTKKSFQMHRRPERRRKNELKNDCKPVACTIKHLTTVIYYVPLKASVFNTVSPFHLSLIFAGKATSLPLE